MKYVKYYGITLLKFLGFLLGGSLILSLLYYLLLPTKIVNVFSFIYMILVFFVFGFKSGKQTENRGFIAGIKIGFLFLFTLFLFNLIVYQAEFGITRIFYYFSLLVASVIGATIGINQKKE